MTREEQEAHDEAAMQARWRRSEEARAVAELAHDIQEALAFAMKEADDLLSGAEGVDRLADPWQRTRVEVMRNTLRLTRKALSHQMTLSAPDAAVMEAGK